MSDKGHDHEEEDDDPLMKIIRNRKGEVRDPTDFKQALQNMQDILIDREKFKFMAQTLFDAIDTENEGTIDCSHVEEFCRDFIRGDGKYDVDTNFEDDNLDAFKLLQDNEAGVCNIEELSKFLEMFLCIQVLALQKRIEK